MQAPAFLTSPGERFPARWHGLSTLIYCVYALRTRSGGELAVRRRAQAPGRGGGAMGGGGLPDRKTWPHFYGASHGWARDPPGKRAWRFPVTLALGPAAGVVPTPGRRRSHLRAQYVLLERRAGAMTPWTAESRGVCAQRGMRPRPGGRTRLPEAAACPRGFYVVIVGPWTCLTQRPRGPGARCQWNSVPCAQRHGLRRAGTGRTRWAGGATRRSPWEVF